MRIHPSEAGKHKRMDRDTTFLLMARILAQRGTCPRRKVGCIMVDDAGHIVSSGYNGTVAKQPHCIDVHCKGANCPSGQASTMCEAIHAEQNALCNCADISKIHTVYCTSAPCIHCVKMLATTGAKRVVFLDEYKHSDSAEYWTKIGRTWSQAKTPIHNKILELLTNEQPNQ